VYLKLVCGEKKVKGLTTNVRERPGEQVSSFVMWYVVIFNYNVCVGVRYVFGDISGQIEELFPDYFNLHLYSLCLLLSVIEYTG